MVAVAGILLAPLALLNMFGLIVAGVWLAVLGQWGTIGVGVALLLVSTFAMGIALLPQMVLGLPAIWCLQRGHKFFGLVFGSISIAYLNVLITVWCVGSLWYFMSRVTCQAEVIPTLIWSYSVATAGWSNAAAQEARSGDGSAAGLTVMFLEIGYVLMMGMIVFANPSKLDVAIAFAAVMTIAFVASITILGVETHLTKSGA